MLHFCTSQQASFRFTRPRAPFVNCSSCFWLVEVFSLWARELATTNWNKFAFLPLNFAVPVTRVCVRWSHAHMRLYENARSYAHTSAALLSSFFFTCVCLNWSYTHAHMRTHTCAYMKMHTRVCLGWSHADICTYAHIHTYTRAQIHMHTRMVTCTHMHSLSRIFSMTFYARQSMSMRGCVRRLVGRLVGWLVGRVVDWSVGL